MTAGKGEYKIVMKNNFVRRINKNESYKYRVQIQYISG